MARRLTDKQRAFVRQVAQGAKPVKAVMRVYDTTSLNSAHQMASENMSKPIIQAALQSVLERNNITLDKAVKPIGQALEANVVIEDKVNGLAIETDIPDLNMRLKGSDRALKLMGVNNDKTSQTFVQINNQLLDKYTEE